MHTAASSTPPPTLPNADQTVDMLAVPSIIFCSAYSVARSENAVNIDCKVWCRNSDYWNVKYYIEEAKKLAFDENDIEIPYSQVDVHIIK